MNEDDKQKLAELMNEAPKSKQDYIEKIRDAVLQEMRFKYLKEEAGLQSKSVQYDEAKKEFYYRGGLIGYNYNGDHNNTNVEVGIDKANLKYQDKANEINLNIGAGGNQNISYTRKF